MAKSDVPYVTKNDIQKLMDLDRQRLEHQRKADALKKQGDAIRQRLMDFVRAQGGKQMSVVRSGYRLEIKLVKGQVAWKQHFVRVAGIEEAERIAADPPKREQLVIDAA